MTPFGSTFDLGGGGGLLTVASDLAGSGKSLNIVGDVVLIGANNYGGNTAILAATNTGSSTAISAGTLQVGNGGTSGSLPPGSVITDNGTLVFNLGNTVTQGTNFSGASITGSGSLTQAGSGSLVLIAANAYSGGTTIAAGTLRLGNSGALGSGGLTLTGGTVDLANYSPTVASLSGAGGTITNSVSPAKLSISQLTLTTFGGAIENGAGGAFSLSLGGAGILALGGTNTYTGGTAVTGGTLELLDNLALLPGSGLTIGRCSPDFRRRAGGCLLGDCRESR